MIGQSIDLLLSAGVLGLIIFGLYLLSGRSGKESARRAPVTEALEVGQSVRCSIGENSTTLYIHGVIEQVQDSRIAVRITELRPWSGGTCTRADYGAWVFEVGRVTWSESGGRHARLPAEGTSGLASRRHPVRLRPIPVRALRRC